MNSTEIDLGDTLNTIPEGDTRRGTFTVSEIVTVIGATFIYGRRLTRTGVAHRQTLLRSIYAD